ACHRLARHLRDRFVERLDDDDPEDLVSRVRSTTPPLGDRGGGRDQWDGIGKRRAPERDAPLPTPLDAYERARVERVFQAAFTRRRRMGATRPSDSIRMARATFGSSGPSSRSNLAAKAARFSSMRRSSAASPTAAETLPPWSLLARFRKMATSSGSIEMLSVTVLPGRLLRFVMFLQT